MRNLFLFCLLLFFFAGHAQKKQMTLEDAILGRYSYLNPEKMKGLNWKNDQVYTWIKNDTLWEGDINAEGQQPLLSLAELNNILKVNSQSGFSRLPGYSWTEENNLLFRSGDKFVVLDEENKELNYEIELPGEAQNAHFSETGQWVAYTLEDDVYVAFKDGTTRQLTFDGGGGIVNGKAVHRREFGISGGIFNAPGGGSVAFYRKDETMVTDYPVVDFMGRIAETKPVKYPMAGMGSHHVTIGVHHLGSNETVFLDTGEPDDHYLTNVSWSPDGKYIYLAELNRGQDHMQLNCYNAQTGEKERTLFEETSNTYVEPLHPLHFSGANEKEFYYLSRRDGWFHLYKYDVSGRLISQVTKGAWEVTRLLGFDSKEKVVFVEGTKESPLERHVYRVDIKTGKIRKLTKAPGIHSGMLSPDGKQLLVDFNGPSIPSGTILVTAEGEEIRTLHRAEDPLEDFALGENRLVSVEAADGQNSLTGRLILPPDFDPSKKYPVIVYVYGGPHSQLVNKSWHHGARWWQYYMASQGFIAFTMDNRGTHYRGRNFETAVHRKLGVLETRDQMQGIEYLKSLPYVDAERIGVHGWSYGGFMTLNMMLRHPDEFKAGVAGGPVVDWSMYEVMYGERYMDRPLENPEGYAETNMVNHVAGLQGKLMLIHGAQDDVVVMQHSMKFLRECIRQNKPVDFFVYPTHPHNVRGKDRLHLMEKVSRYFLDNL